MLFILWITISHSVFLVLHKCHLSSQYGLSLFREVLCVYKGLPLWWLTGSLYPQPTGPLWHCSKVCHFLNSLLAVMPTGQVRCFPAEGRDFEDSLNYITSRNIVTKLTVMTGPTPQSPQDCPYLDITSLGIPSLTRLCQLPILGSLWGLLQNW